jgi:hypothetical protein
MGGVMKHGSGINCTLFLLYFSDKMPLCRICDVNILPFQGAPHDRGARNPRRCHWAGVYQAFSLAANSSCVSGGHLALSHIFHIAPLRTESPTYSSPMATPWVTAHPTRSPRPERAASGLENMVKNRMAGVEKHGVASTAPYFHLVFRGKRPCAGYVM